MNAKYFRLKNLQISYNLKRDLLKNCNFIQGCRITLSGTNLFTVSDVLDFTDPEAKMIEPDKIEKIFVLYLVLHILSSGHTL